MYWRQRCPKRGEWLTEILLRVYLLPNYLNHESSIDFHLQGISGYVDEKVIILLMTCLHVMNQEYSTVYCRKKKVKTKHVVAVRNIKSFFCCKSCVERK